ncbi:MAG: hypothetical protein GWM98_23830, partial [Nitrospinaceae bacterium]|nr:hypothetical protein [Nitrospinaceae bacterium]NIR56936.1 hypothetical protein [Nitrospinaceae bacterium]NIS87392.1 hypothetical protein [Nitrospinaceae bacterium]NIT84244.1 hypothetical protein [Nitrospinaceae bacterium]NIU46432.1 hypothetical protein [Nitrospinaceae bacterium]
MDQGLEKARDVLKQTDFDLNHLRIESGRVLLVPPQDHPLLQGELPLEVSLDLWVSRPSREQLKLRVEDLDLALDGFRFQGRLEVDDLLSSTGRLTADLQSGSFPVSDLNRLRSSIPSLELPRALRRGQVKRIQIACSAPVMAMTDWESLRRTAKADLKLSIRDAAWNLEDSEIPLNTLKAD